jgi:membrane carboxypeptidase/penicillin-binding protein
MEAMRSPDLEGAAGIHRVKELMTVSVLDAMGFDYMDVYVTQFFVSRR